MKKHQKIKIFSEKVRETKENRQYLILNKKVSVISDLEKVCKREFSLQDLLF